MEQGFLIDNETMEAMSLKIDLNRADERALQQVIHIGPARAKKIIQARPFRDLFELSNVKGLGKKRMWDIINQGFAVAQTA